jgi:hypothetical protein
MAHVACTADVAKHLNMEIAAAAEAAETELAGCACGTTALLVLSHQKWQGASAILHAAAACAGMTAKHLALHLC